MSDSNAWLAAKYCIESNAGTTCSIGFLLAPPTDHKVRDAPGRALERLVRGQRIGGGIRRGTLCSDLMRGDFCRTEIGLHLRTVPCRPICGRRCESRDAGRKQIEGLDGDDQGSTERTTDR